MESPAAIAAAHALKDALPGVYGTRYVSGESRRRPQPQGASRGGQSPGWWSCFGTTASRSSKSGGSYGRPPPATSSSRFSQTATWFRSSSSSRHTVRAPPLVARRRLKRAAALSGISTAGLSDDVRRSGAA